MKVPFIFSCSGMFRNVPECSMFLVLSTPVYKKASCISDLLDGVTTLLPPPSPNSPHGFATHSSAKTSSAVRKNEPALIIRDGGGRAYQNFACDNDSAG